ncbi:hypothetical protein ABL78_5197 [Leptomonas seymouri]|uniref:Pentacotripeptide-repeat region of PRORP domain-containing protein n=1 Tax=Leptomonas seymouri TaxID=5684 RepID=A0A0N1PCQ1_LEPSE|nr:hypothetical protein ABL78_5197 [Leptomonas seymouri]|eukprot:KPI85748.1 hypothetical protein ABL78_5197 [Leptomonas seymouri]
MQRHRFYVTQSLGGFSTLLRSGFLESPAAQTHLHTARSYTHQASSSEASVNHAFPLRQHRPSSMLSRAARRRTASVPTKEVQLAEATNDTQHASGFPGGNAAPSSEWMDPVTDTMSQRQTHSREPQRTTPTTRTPSRSPRRPQRPTATVSSATLMKFLEEQHPPFAATLRKKLAPRHTGPHGAVVDRHSAHQTDEQRRTEEELRAEENHAIQASGYDPALVVRTDSRRRQVRLNSVQREMIWTARQQQYQGLLQRIVGCLQSHRSPVEKCQTLFALHDDAIRQHLRLRADTYEDMFHTLYSVGVKRGGGAGQPGKASMSASAQLVPGDAQWESELSGHSAAKVSGGSLPAELASPAAASSTVLSAHGVEHVWEMYRYSVDSGTDPTARMLQYVMGLLEHASVALAVGRASPSALTESRSHGINSSRRTRSRELLLVEAKAHSLMMDADRFRLTPTEYTINSYIGICEACDVMHLALARVTDYQTRHERQPSAGTYARLITGLVRCGHYEDAMAVVTTMQNVPMSTYLLNAVLQAARHSRDPSSAFTFYRSLFVSPSSPLRMNEKERRAAPPARLNLRLAPSLATFSILVEVMQATHSHGELDFVLAEMQHYRIKGNGMLLNKILRLMDEGGASPKKKDALRRAMESKQIRVFDEHRERHSLLSPT